MILFHELILGLANKRTIESLVLSGGFDSFEIDRSQYFHVENDQSYIEKNDKIWK